MTNYNLSEYNLNKANTNENENQNITKLTLEQTMLFDSIKIITTDITNNIFKDSQTVSKPKQKVDIKQFFTGDAFLFDYKFLDSNTFKSYLEEFTRLLSEVHLIIAKQNTDKVQTLQIKLNQLKDSIL